MDVAVRAEQPADEDAIRRVHHAAFGQPDEGLIVDGIRGTPDWIEDGSIVAVERGTVIGHLLLSRGALVAAHGDRLEIWMVGPVAVMPAYQRRGVGSALMEAAIRLARAHRLPLLCLLGHGSYYPRFGFEPARALGIDPPAEWPADAWQALRLPGWTPRMRGVARYAPAFGID